MNALGPDDRAGARRPSPEAPTPIARTARQTCPGGPVPRIPIVGTAAAFLAVLLAVRAIGY